MTKESREIKNLKNDQLPPIPTAPKTPRQKIPQRKNLHPRLRRKNFGGKCQKQNQRPILHQLSNGRIRDSN